MKVELLASERHDRLHRRRHQTVAAEIDVNPVAQDSTLKRSASDRRKIDPSNDHSGRDEDQGQTSTGLIGAETFRNIGLLPPLGEEVRISRRIPRSEVTLVFNLSARKAHPISALD